MTLRWRCNNTVLFVRESRVSASEIFGVFFLARLIGFSRFIVPPPRVLCESDTASLKEPTRSQIFPFGTRCVQKRQEVNFELEGGVCKTPTTHSYHLVCRLIATSWRTFPDPGFQVLLVRRLLCLLHPRRYCR